MITPWGYEILSEQSLDNFVTPQEVNDFTGGRFQGDVRVQANIAPATSSIRNYCGWHIAPSVDCVCTMNIRDLRDAFEGNDLLVQLPARLVTEIKSILLNAKYDSATQTWEGDELGDYDIQTNGLLKVFDVGCCDRKSKLRIVYKAGYDLTDIPLIKELTAHRISHACASSYGINSESAGGVSVSYNAAWAGNTRSTALPDDNKEILEPYKVKGMY